MHWLSLQCQYFFSSGLFSANSHLITHLAFTSNSKDCLDAMVAMSLAMSIAIAKGTVMGLVLDSRGNTEGFSWLLSEHPSHIRFAVS